ncbi:lasso peptide biosynthesis B2 protein [Streptomyces hainanensis]|uniref:Lasso peptide biosynthesis B2 protein n=1 Tax=Streptomyces hainanensis TaxID=402648 RepID=A0A4R4TL62_9ACTN|nr:lasso peptide biosynthesis B2 protein [Streptomyces hainanensis]TDC78637.1 lasso peptide biosynthesis B2 protein [Streptomyces hainanensis]
MSTPILPEPGIRTSGWRGIRARAAVAVAIPLSRLSPGRVQRVLGFVVRGGTRPTPADVLRWRGAVVGVSRRCAGEGCLPRSVAVMLLARSHGFAPVWKTGFRPSPFIGHAWVEVDGVAVGEPDIVGTFLTTLQVSPAYRDERHEADR